MASGPRLTVNLISSSAATISVPAAGSCSMMVPAAASGYLDDHQLVLVEKEAHSEDVPEGQVIKQKPGAGASVKPGDKVEVTFSLGPEKKRISIFSLTVLTGFFPGPSENATSTLSPALTDAPAPGFCLMT